MPAATTARRAAGALLLAAAAAAPAQPAAPTGPSVALSGTHGADRALLVVDGRPLILSVGESARGVTLLRLRDGAADVRVGASAATLRLGASPVVVGASGRGAAQAGAATIVLPAGPGGHYVVGGQINGRATTFMVDTGATAVTLGQAEAERLGLDWRGGTPTLGATANGVVPMRALTISSIRIGGVEVANVEAVVLPGAMPAVLLGNAYLDRFTMRRDGSTMRLDKRP